MRTSRVFVALASLLTPLGLVTVATAAPPKPPVERFRADQRGDFVMFGNILGQDCFEGDEGSAPPPDPLVGNVDCSALTTGIDDSSPDIFWQSDDDAQDAIANSGINAEGARSTAVLIIPEGATVTYARIYWAGMLISEEPQEQWAADQEITIERPGSPGLVTTVEVEPNGELLGSWVVPEVYPDGPGYWYQSTAEITEFVAQAGPGAFRVSGVDSVELPTIDNQHPVASWAVVVFYEEPGADFHNLVLFDTLLPMALENEETEVRVDTYIDGFRVPPGDYDAKLGVLAYEGEERWDGDSLWFDSAPESVGPLYDAQNEVDNFFNGSRSKLGDPVSNDGDLPRLTGGPNSLGNVDMDVVDVTSKVTPGKTSAVISASTSGDTYLLAAFVTSISTYRPEFVTSTKTLTDLNEGTIVPGDIIEYEITAINTGNDTSTHTVISDPLTDLDHVSFVEGSILIDGESQTDAPGDDLAEYLADEGRIVARIGTGATSDEGGSVPVDGLNGADGTVTITFQVRAESTGNIENQAFITAEGERGAPENTEATDSDPEAPGAQSVRGIIVEPGDRDSDGLTDDVEGQIGTDPDDADSDDDGLIDGREVDPTEDTDGDEDMNALDSDSDGDGLFDGTEMGEDCSNDDTNRDEEQCIPDADDGFTVTNPLDADTDDGGVTDGMEDTNHNGRVDVGETTPTVGNGGDDDTDRDGLSNTEEEAIDTDPEDADSDDDGLIDGDELQPGADSDGDGAINARDYDSDDDGLFDGTEMGRDCENPATNLEEEHCVADADEGATTTNPLDADTDGGGVEDRAEDRDGDGAIDDGETNPTAGHGDDDDSDWDGLSDTDEEELDTDPLDADSDDDGVPDGRERDPGGDTDDDGDINAKDPDSDDDGLSDGTEMGLGCDGEDPDAEYAGTDLSAEQCVPDGDNGLTITDPLDADTDDGGVDDGVEDQDQDGALDAGETDPRAGHGADDDSDCDGLSDSDEEEADTDPEDRDSDDDGVLDGQERDPAGDADEDGLPNAMDPDSDGDGLFDGTEMGFDCADEDTSADAETCVADADAGETTTDPLDPDTDDGTVSDGEEDANLDGDIDGEGDDAERNPNFRYDDVPAPPEDNGGAGGAGGQPPVEEPAGAAGTAVQYPKGFLEGGGCSCTVPAESGRHGLAGVMLALGGLLLRRTRRR